jgi:hypothetical protein
MREAEVEAYLVGSVERLGGKTAKLTVRGQRGWPDRLVLLPGGIVLFVELKRPKGGVMSAVQKEMHIKIWQLGARVCRVNTIEQIDELLRMVSERKHPWFIASLSAGDIPMAGQAPTTASISPNTRRTRR